MIDFYNWEMPLNYGSQIKEHHAVRNDVGIFDVSHMTVIDFEGKNSIELLNRVLVSNPATLFIGQAIYSALLNEQAGIIDDVILYRLDDHAYRLVSNCGTNITVLNWLKHCLAEQKLDQVSINERPDLAIISIQGPSSLSNNQLYPSEYLTTISQLKSFCGGFGGAAWITRTGYTGELGLEIILPTEMAPNLWQHVLAQEVQPIGLGARDSLRLEAGLNLYGQDMDDRFTPLESNMSRLIHWQPEERDFIGRKALANKRAQASHKLVGLILQEPGVPRKEHPVYNGSRLCGLVTSGGISPSLKRGIALARVEQDTPKEVSIAIRSDKKRARITRLPFYKRKPG